MWIIRLLQGAAAGKCGGSKIEEHILHEAGRFVNRDRLPRLSVEEYMRKWRSRHE